MWPHSSEIPTGSNCDGSSPIHRRHRRYRLPQRALAGRRVYPPSFRTPAGPPGQISLICITDAAGIETVRPAQNGVSARVPSHKSTTLRDHLAIFDRTVQQGRPSPRARTAADERAWLQQESAALGGQSGTQRCYAGSGSYRAGDSGPVGVPACGNGAGGCGSTVPGVFDHQ